MGNNKNLSCSPPNRNHMANFNNVLNDCSLLNLGHNGPRLTWTNKRDSRLVMKWLDRALCNLSWKLLFEETKVVHLPRTSSNHYPILINTLPSPPYPCNRPFHLETMWFNDPSFPNVVKDAWHSHPNNTILALKEFTKRIKIWNRDVFSNIFNKKKWFLACLNGIQKAFCNNNFLFLLNLEKDLNLEYQHIFRLEEDSGLWNPKLIGLL